MLLTFDLLLRQTGIDPLNVRLVRHQDASSTKGRTPYRLWMDNRPEFERYQRAQNPKNRAKLSRPHWAVFVGAPGNATLFVGLYDISYVGVAEVDQIAPHNDQIDRAGAYDTYRVELNPALSNYAGLLYIAWGEAYRSWIQRADKRIKPIIELRQTIREPDYPGHSMFVRQLSEVENLPLSWQTPLASSKGVYLLTCPRTHEQYVGAAVGENGFFGRWLDYARSGHGGNVALKSRDRSDYRVSILEVAASSASMDDILALEARWKSKLQSKEMGLNRN